MINDFHLTCSLEDDGEGFSSNIKLKEPLHLHGKWEVALVEMISELSNGIELDVAKTSADFWGYNMFFVVGAVKVGYNDVNVRIAISNEYTRMWNQAADKRDHYTVLRKLSHALRNKPTSGTKHKFTMSEIISMLNEDIKEQEESMKNRVEELGLRWEGVPKLSVFNNRKIKIEFPKYIKMIGVGKKLCKLLGFINNLKKFNDYMSVVCKRKAVPISCPFTGKYQEQPLYEYRFNGLEPLSYVISDEDFQVNSDGKNMFIYCTLLDYRIVGSITTPLLRFTPLKIDKHTIDLIDFENLFYYPLLYNDINEFGIKVLNELGQEIKFYNTRPTFLLHFRRRNV